MQKQLDIDLFDILKRIGSSPREQLSWLVSLIESRAPQTPEDWGNLRRELLVFAMHAAGAPSYGLACRDKDEEKLLEAIAEVLELALRRKESALPMQPRKLRWDSSTGRFYEAVDLEQDTFRNAVLRGLSRRLMECGHLLKECQAPAKVKPGRKRKGEPKPEEAVCGKLFVARKQTQLYCSGACLSRTLTRKKRAEKKVRTLRGKRRKRKVK
jgi:hypothetical protein